VKGSKKITLSWIAVAGSDTVDIFLQDWVNGIFNRLATVNMSDEKYELQTSINGEHIFKFVPDNGGTEVHYIVNIW
jgi:CelD/BcsL family acetyltransferase involved in cellulose biosynthesis